MSTYYNSKNKITVLNVLFDDRYGGPHKRVIEVSKKLMSVNIETIMCLPDRNGDAAVIAEDMGLTVRCINYSKTPNPKSPRQIFMWLFFLQRDIFRFKRLFKQEKPDVIHVNGAFFIQPAIAARQLGIPLIWHLNDTIVPGGIARVLGKIVKSYATKIVVAADAVAHHYGIEGNYKVIYAPVDVERFMRKSRWEDATVSKNSLVKVGLIANWNPIKGIEYFIEAASRLVSDTGRRYVFILAGKKINTHEKYSASLEKLIQDLSLSEHIILKGFVSSIEDLLIDLDIVVLSSISEACPMVVLEGMAAGVPVVATNVGGVSELLLPESGNPAGKVISSRDSVAIADAIRELVDNKEKYKNMGFSGRKMAREFFSLEVCAQKHAQVYRDALDGDV